MADDDEDDVKPQEGSTTTQRRVYALPTETVERIVEYQREKGFQSEVEAVRRLLDEALKSRDTPVKLINRFLAKLEVHRVASEAAREVVVGHPLVEGLRFGKESVLIQMSGAPEVTIWDNAAVTFGQGTMEQWKWLPNKSNKYGPGMIDDGEIPF
ncbi:MAG: hypothetical protein EON59_07360 [Alphaproteobacteria bacterium]|nr:MAG: hypothetical protein EON59_07360 [Alphaproteobacteria bacterium]